MDLKSIQNGAVAGIAGGTIFGIIMGVMGMLTLMGQMVGLPNALAGFVVHLTISACIGGVFGLLLRPFIKNVAAGLCYGTAYGAVWWLLGPMTLMPAIIGVGGMGSGVDWNAEAAVGMLLVGYLLYGLILGGIFEWLTHRSRNGDPFAPEACEHFG